MAQIHGGIATKALYLARTSGDWVVSALGKTGEPRAHRPLTERSRLMSLPAQVWCRDVDRAGLRLDVAGRIVGPAADESEVVVDERGDEGPERGVQYREERELGIAFERRWPRDPVEIGRKQLCVIVDHAASWSSSACCTASMSTIFLLAVTAASGAPSARLWTVTQGYARHSTYNPSPTNTQPVTRSTHRRQPASSSHRATRSAERPSTSTGTASPMP